MFINLHNFWQIYCNYLVLKYCRPHYNVILKSIQVGGEFLKLPTDIYETGDNQGTILDSGTTLAYLPEEAFKALMNAVRKIFFMVEIFFLLNIIY